MKAYFFGILIMVSLMATPMYGQGVDGFYKSLTELPLPYNFSYEMHRYGAKVDLPASLVQQDPILENFKAVGKVDLDRNNYFVIVKRIFSDDNDNVFFLLAINKSGKIVSGLPVDLTSDDGRKVDFKITEDKVIQIVNYDQSNTARIKTVTFSSNKFVHSNTETTTTRSSLSGK